MARLTKRTMEKAQANGVERFIWDDSLPGFGLRISRSGKRGYLIQYRAKGRTRRLALGLHGVLTEQARRRAAELLSDVRRGGDPSAQRSALRQAPTIADLSDRFFSDYAEGRKKASSIRMGRHLMEKHILPGLGRRRVVDVDHSEVARLHSKLRETPFTANRVKALLSKMFALAERWGLRPNYSNPTRHVESYPEPARERFLSDAELARLGEVLSEVERSGAASADKIAIIRFLALTGCRVSEIRTLRWEEVDLERGCLRLRDSKTGPKTVTLNTPAVQVLAKRAEIESGTEWVFPAPSGTGPIRSLERTWVDIRERAGMPDVRMHDLRHSFASVGASSGQSPLVIGALLGHKRPPRLSAMRTFRTTR